VFGIRGRAIVPLGVVVIMAREILYRVDIEVRVTKTAGGAP
jgi:hypothetical protein